MTKILLTAKWKINGTVMPCTCFKPQLTTKAQLEIIRKREIEKFRKESKETDERKLLDIVVTFAWEELNPERPKGSKWDEIEILSP